jgi:hypothetical protein
MKNNLDQRENINLFLWAIYNINPPVLKKVLPSIPLHMWSLDIQWPFPSPKPPLLRKVKFKWL